MSLLHTTIVKQLDVVICLLKEMSDEKIRQEIYNKLNKAIKDIKSTIKK